MEAGQFPTGQISGLKVTIYKLFGILHKLYEVNTNGTGITVFAIMRETQFEDCFSGDHEQ